MFSKCLQRGNWVKYTPNFVYMVCARPLWGICMEKFPLTASSNATKRPIFEIGPHLVIYDQFPWNFLRENS